MFSHYDTRKISPICKISTFSEDLSFLNPRSHLKRSIKLWDLQVIPAFTCKNQNCTENQSIYQPLHFGVLSCRYLSDRFYINLKSVALWKLSDKKIVPNYSSLSDMNFITTWNLTGVVETTQSWQECYHNSKLTQWMNRQHHPKFLASNLYSQKMRVTTFAIS